MRVGKWRVRSGRALIFLGFLALKERRRCNIMLKAKMSISTSGYRKSQKAKATM
jgi:hypothetical protein